ncbi:MAG TPA: hypothetical protein VGM50_08630 [Gemmatimonadaceae bacterium]
MASEETSKVPLELHAGAKTMECGHINDGLTFVGFRLRGTKISVKPTNLSKYKKRITAAIAMHEEQLRTGLYASPRKCAQQALHHVNRKIIGVDVGDTQRS